MWQIALAASLGIALPYLLISGIILRGLIQRGQVRSNPLGLGTALIFFSCGVGHWLHGLHLLEGERYRGAVDWHMVTWDLSTAAIAVWYLSMRRRYNQLLIGPLMFDDPVRVAAEGRARHAATHDALTGLANRTALRSATRAALEPTSGAAAVCVIFLDLDGFKAINDTHGHHVGDVVLQGVSRRLEDAIRPGDLLARLGGDEFVVLVRTDAWAEGPEVEGAAVEGAAIVADGLIASLHEPFHVEGVDLTVTASAGVACARPGSSLELLFRSADDTMYRAKQAGGDRSARTTSDPLAPLRPSGD